MNIMKFFDRIRKKILRVLLGRDMFVTLTGKELFGKINNLTQLINTLSEKLDSSAEKIDSSAAQIHKLKTLLLLKEKSPELLGKIASGFSSDEQLITNLFHTDIFSDLRDDFRSIVWQMYEYLVGAGCIPFNIIRKTFVEMSKNPSLKIPAFSMLANISMPNYENNDIAIALEQTYERAVLQDQWCGYEYINFLLLRQEEEKAREILNDYFIYHDKETITRSLPISNFAYRLGIKSEDIITASKLFQTIMENTRNQLLEKYIGKFSSNAKIAIVGNGPHEIGSGNGSKIDAHDIVVRFNNYDESPEYANDYGSKVNIIFFAFNPNGNEILRKKADILVCRNIYEEPLENDVLQEYRVYPISNITTLESVPTRQEIQSKYGINWPSTGLLAIYYFKNVLKTKLAADNLYGFSVNTDYVREGHYEDMNMKAPHKLHNLGIELTAIQDILK